MVSFNRIVTALSLALTLSACTEKYDRPETWFHVIGGNASKEGIVADLDALKEAGIGGIQFFHGQINDIVWPGVTNQIQCMSEQWMDLVKFTSEECHKRGLTFKMQNCPGWSMSGGPWITLDKAMRKLVCFEPGKKPAFDKDDDYHEICTLTFPIEKGARMITLPAPSKFSHGWCYEPDIEFSILTNGIKEWSRECPTGCWSDTWSRELVTMTFDITGVRGTDFHADSPHPIKKTEPVFDDIRRLDNWEAKAGHTLRSFNSANSDRPFAPNGNLTLTFGHVNMKCRNHPAPPEATGWECDKLSPDGFTANWEGYLGKLVKSGVKIDGTLVDSWECGSQNWTWNMESEFAKRNGYELRPWLPALFGYILKSEVETEKFLLDWRNTCSRLIEENYFGTIARLAHENDMSVQYETAFGDVIVGDILRYWKYADEPMCEFWSPHENKGFVGSHNFKPVLPCVSAAHIYGKKRVSAESLTSFDLTFDENFTDWKNIINKHFNRGVTHIVFHTYTHNPIVNGKAPGSSFGGAIGSPFLRLQPWWKYMKDFTDYLAFVGHELERGVPVVDILMYLGDDVNHKPSESELLFGNKYKYDYLNQDALMTRVSVKGKYIELPDGTAYRVIWIPEGTYLKPETEKKFAELEKQGARIVRGDFTPDWTSPLNEFVLGIDPKDYYWYQRQDGHTKITFIASKDGAAEIYYYKTGRFSSGATFIKKVNAITRKTMDFDRPDGPVVKQSLSFSLRFRADEAATLREYECVFSAPEAKRYILDLGDVRNWATVYVNGKEAARLWCRPYKCDISDFVKPGENKLEIEVTSTIYNQLVIDAGKPENEQKTWTIAGPEKDSPLHPSGLLGPVTLQAY